MFFLGIYDDVKLKSMLFLSAFCIPKFLCTFICEMHRIHLLPKDCELLLFCQKSYLQPINQPTKEENKYKCQIMHYYSILLCLETEIKLIFTGTIQVAVHVLHCISIFVIQLDNCYSHRNFIFAVLLYLTIAFLLECIYLDQQYQKINRKWM